MTSDDLMPGLAYGLALGLVCGAICALILVWGHRRRIRALREAKTRREIEGNRVGTVAQILHYAIQSSPNAVAVVDRNRRVVMSNPRAHELGVVHERQINNTAWGVAERVFADHEPREVHFVPQGRRTSRPIIAVAGQAQMLSFSDDRYVVLYVADDSENVRMESARRDFVANVSHELKTPVGAISLLVETLMEVKDDPDSVDYFGSKLSGEVARMNQMITELISLSKLQGAESLPDPEVLNVDAIITDAMERCRLSAEAHSISITKDADCEALVYGDHNLLVTSLANLITNAINYSPDATPVSISREVTEELVHIRVTDRGIGIDPQNQQRVFERFFRVDKARSRTTGGTGLGLAIVKHVMANHGGRVTLWSRPGTGSTFTLELPRFADADPAAVAVMPPGQDNQDNDPRPSDPGAGADFHGKGH